MWQTPHPVCKPDPCFAPPLKVAHQFEEPSGVYEASACASASLANPVASNTSCPMRCKPGYVPRGAGAGFGAFLCSTGKYVSPVCESRQCSAIPTVANGRVTCLGVRIGVDDECQVICKAGYRLVGNQKIKCSPDSSVAESPVSLSQPGKCVAYSCGELKLPDAKGIVKNYSDGMNSSLSTGVVATVGCAEGYQLTETSFDSYKCLATFDAPEVASAWIGSLSCERIACNRSQRSRLGYFTCEQALFGDLCQLECPVGYALQDGTGQYQCTASGELVGAGVCKEVDCPADGRDLLQGITHATGTDCPQRFNSTTTCGITCEDGYSSRGSFSCFYGGFSQMPACIADGGKADVLRFTLSSLNVAFTQLPRPVAD